MSECSHIHSDSLRQDVFKLLNKNHELTPKQLCKQLDRDYKTCRGTIAQYRKQWRHEYRSRQALSCLGFHNVRGWLYALKVMDRKVAVEVGGWQATRARNGMIVFRVVGVGRCEWFRSGRVNFWVLKPATRGRVKTLLAKAFFSSGLVGDVDVFDLWADSARLKGGHVTLDLGERLPYGKIELLKDGLGVVAKVGDVSHKTCLELEFVYPDWMEKNELLFGQLTKLLGSLAQPKPLDRDYVT